MEELTLLHSKEGRLFGDLQNLTHTTNLRLIVRTGSTANKNCKECPGTRSPETVKDVLGLKTKTRDYVLACIEDPGLESIPDNIRWFCPVL
jgi:hypothetical protein